MLLPSFENISVLELSRQGKLHAHAEVLCHGGVGRGGEQRLGVLAVVVKRHGHILAHRIVGTERSLDCLVARGGFGQSCLDVSPYGILIAKNTWEKGLQYAYRDRKNKKRNFRALWIQRINAAARLEGMSYSQLMGALHKAGIAMNRKVLADLAMNHPEAFKAIVAKAKNN